MMLLVLLAEEPFARNCRVAVEAIATKSAAVVAVAVFGVIAVLVVAD